MSLIELDNTITFAIYRWGASNETLQYILLALATLFIYTVPIIILWLYLRSYKDRLNAIKIMLSAALAWQIFTNFVGSYFYENYGFRARPFGFDGLTEYFFERPEKAFPSDHAAVMMAVALAFFGYKYPKLGWLFLIGGLISSFGRIAVGFHYLGDILGGFLLAAIAYLIIRALDRVLDQYLEPVIKRLPPRLNG